MEIITGQLLNKKFKNISEYKLDLGLAIKIEESNRNSEYNSGGKWKIKDKTIKKYYDNFGKYLTRSGKIGTLLFYVDYTLNNNDIYIIHKNEIYLSKYDNTPIRDFISDLIRNVLDNKLNPYIEIEERKEKEVDLKNMTNDELAEYLAKNR